MPLRTVVYLRKSSTDREDKQVHSIDRQRADISVYLEKNAKSEKFDSELFLKVDLAKDLFYEDASSKKTGRVEFGRMIQEIQKHKYDVLLCTDLSRLSRNVIDSATIVQLLEDCVLKEIRTLDKIFTTSPTDKFTLSLFLAVSKYENDQRALNTASGMRNRRSSGATTYKAPIGYINVGEEKGKKSVEKDGDNFDKVRTLWDLFLDGSWSIKALTEHARDIGVTVATSKNKRKSPSSSTIRTMFSNQYYLGLIQDVDKDGQQIWKDGSHPFMVIKEEFESAQFILQKLGHKHVKMDKAPDLPSIVKAISVSGLYEVVDQDGFKRRASMIFEGKVRYVCTHCHNRYYSNKPKNCPKCETPVSKDTKIENHERIAHYTADHKKLYSMKFSIVEAFLKKELDGIHISDGLFEVLRKRLYTLWLEKHKVIASKLKGLRAVLVELEDEHSDLCRKQFKVGADMQSLGSAKRKVEIGIEDQKESIDDLVDEEETQFEEAWQKLQVLRDAKDVLSPKIDFEPKKRLILSLISNLVFYKDKIQVEWKKPFNVLAKSNIVKTANCSFKDDSMSISLSGSR